MPSAARTGAGRRAEVRDLTGLLRHYVRQELAELKEEGVRLRVIGDLSRFDDDICADLDSGPSGRRPATGG